MEKTNRDMEIIHNNPERAHKVSSVGKEGRKEGGKKLWGKLGFGSLWLCVGNSGMLSPPTKTEMSYIQTRLNGRFERVGLRRPCFTQESYPAGQQVKETYSD